VNPFRALNCLIGPAGIACLVISVIWTVQILENTMRPGSVARWELKIYVDRMLSKLRTCAELWLKSERAIVPRSRG
jgi:hypothetical protein